MSQRALFEVKASEHLQTLDEVRSRRAGLMRVGLLLMAAILLTLWLVRGSATAAGLFQSPQSPPAEPQAVEQPAPAEEPPPAEPPPAEEAPAAQEQPAQQSAPAEQPSVQESPLESPAQEPAPSPEAAEPAPGSGEGSTDDVSPAGQESPEASGRPPRSRERDEEAALIVESAEENASVRDFILDRAEFIDTVVVSGAYLWLCCGLGLFLLVPLFMVVLYIRGRSKVIAEEEY